jgi:hypothetical protein
MNNIRRFNFGCVYRNIILNQRRFPIINRAKHSRFVSHNSAHRHIAIRQFSSSKQILNNNNNNNNNNNTDTNNVDRVNKKIPDAPAGKPPQEPHNDDDAEEEWQQYIDSATNKPFYQHLESGRTQWEQPKWYYPAGKGIDEHVGLTMLRSDRMSANPYKKPSRAYKLLNVVLLGGCLLYIAYNELTRVRGDEQQKRQAMIAENKKKRDSIETF